RDPEQLAKFRADMARFEQRMSTQDLGSISVSFTYEQIERLLQAQGSEPLTEQERLKLAEDLMSQAATPSSVDQGTTGSAAGLALERKTYADSPSEAARLVVDIALTGEYETRDGNVIRLSRDKLTADAEAQASPRKPGMRSYASQIFQSAPAAKDLE